MKSQIKLILIIVLLSLIPVSGVYSQESCKVLKAGIDSAYAGACKKDLAHGIGEAWGLDHYIGDFKRGLPHGEGVYEYKDGSVYKGDYSRGLRNGYGEYSTDRANIDTTLKGIWENDIFIGKKKEMDYQILSQLEINRYTLLRQGDENKVIFRINNSVSSKPALLNVVIRGSSGQMNSSDNIFYFKNIVYPFTLTVRYTKWNRLGISTIECEFEVVINKAGQWKVSLY